MVSREEIETPPEQRQVEKQAEPLHHDEIVSRAHAAKSARVDADVAARFKAGETVRARNIHPAGHTRLPRYVRSRTGMVDKDYGVFVFPDTRAVFDGDKPQHLYSVCFTARELWGDDASARDKVYLDIWDDYLELG